jgi:hypothetical protein
VTLSFTLPLLAEKWLGPAERGTSHDASANMIGVSEDEAASFQADRFRSADVCGRRLPYGVYVFAKGGG